MLHLDAQFQSYFNNCETITCKFLTPVVAAAFLVIASLVPVCNVQGLHKSPVLVPQSQPSFVGREEVATIGGQLASPVKPPDILPEVVENGASAIHLRDMPSHFMLRLRCSIVS